MKVSDEESSPKCVTIGDDAPLRDALMLYRLTSAIPANILRQLYTPVLGLTLLEIRCYLIVWQIGENFE
jgi:hypothetical protein